MSGVKSDRTCLAHYIDSAFSTDYSECAYGILGVDNEDLSVELNPEVETKKNVIGDNIVNFSGYDPEISVDPFYHRAKDTFSKVLAHIAMARLHGEAHCKTSYVEVLYEMAEDGKSAPTVIEAWREDCMVIPNSYGGDTSGLQIPFQIKPCGNRVEGTWDRGTATFTAKGNL